MTDSGKAGFTLAEDTARALSLQSVMDTEQHTESDVDPREVDAEMIRSLYRRVVPLVFANFGALWLLTFALWSNPGRGYLLFWAISLSGWTMLRFGLAHLYMLRDRTLQETGRWTLAFVVGSTVAGCLWGSSIFLVSDLSDDNAKLITAFIMAALSAAAIAGYSNSLPAFAGFVAPSLLPYGLRLIWLDGAPDPSIAAFVVFWGMLLWIMARHQNQGVRETIALSLRNRNLAWRIAGERDRAQAANRAKTRFLGHMSHELRTPLNAIIGYADMMRSETLGPIANRRYADYVRDIFDSGRHLLSMFDQILAVSKLEQGEMLLKDAQLAPGPLVEAVADDFRPRCESSNQCLRVMKTGDLPDLRGDEKLVAQMVRNLLENAVTHTPQGGEIGVRLSLNGKGGIRLSVSDTGVGMDEDAQALALVPFARLEQKEHTTRCADDAEAGGHTSVGLGLPIVNLLAQAHGATLELHSAPGQGTTATVQFPPERSCGQVADKAA